MRVLKSALVSLVMELIYHRASVQSKLQNLETDIIKIFQLDSAVFAPDIPARERISVRPRGKGERFGLASRVGQGQLIHNLASIELQALELCVRTLAEFPDAPADFRFELKEIALQEAAHLKLCLGVLEEYELSFGHWPIHTGLWEATSAKDSLLDRILIVHRYLEGAGLDAGQAILSKLSQVEGGSSLKKVIRTIAEEEIEHVAFGSRWYHKICASKKIDSNSLFQTTMRRLYSEIPKREPIHKDCRKKAGFTGEEIEFLVNQRGEKSRQPHTASPA